MWAELGTWRSAAAQAGVARFCGALDVEPGFDEGVCGGCKEERIRQTLCAGSLWVEKQDVGLVAF